MKIFDPPSRKSSNSGDGGRSRGRQRVTCEEAEPLLHRHAEGELDGLRALRMRQHLDACPGCRERYLSLLEERRWLLESLQRKIPELPESFATKVSARIEREADRRRILRKLTLSEFIIAALALAAISLLAIQLISSPETREASPNVATGDSTVPPALTPASFRNGDAAPAPSSLPDTGVVLASVDSGNCWPDEYFEDGFFDSDEFLDPIFPPVVIVCRYCADAPLTALVSTGDEEDPPFVRPSYHIETCLAHLTNAILNSSPEIDPCLGDPNGDGKTDGLDVLFVLQNDLQGMGDSSHLQFTTTDYEPESCWEELCI